MVFLLVGLATHFKWALVNLEIYQWVKNKMILKAQQYGIF